MLTTKNLTVTYNGDQNVLENISLQIDHPAIIGIIGPNGAGKSTLIKAMLQLIHSRGRVALDGQPIEKNLANVAYVAQKSAIDYTFPITVRECVCLGTYAKLRMCQRVSAKNWQKADEVLEMVGLTDFANRQISALSGGQFQRMLVARCLAQETDYIFLDEPFVGIDSVSEQIIMNLLRDLKQQGKIILMVHHDLNKVKDYFDDLIILNRQLIAFGSTDEVFHKDNLVKAYGGNIIVEGVRER